MNRAHAFGWHNGLCTTNFNQIQLGDYLTTRTTEILSITDTCSAQLSSCFDICRHCLTLQVFILKRLLQLQGRMETKDVHPKWPLRVLWQFPNGQGRRCRTGGQVLFLELDHKTIKNTFCVYFWETCCLSPQGSRIHRNWSVFHPLSLLL